MPGTPALADLRYHDYVAMVTFLQEPLAVRKTGEAAHDIHTKIAANLTRSCGRYRHNLSRHAQAYAAVNGTTRPPGSPRRPPDHAQKGAPNRVAPFLYNPINWVAFGRSDALALVLFDDTDPLVSVMAEIQSPIDQATLAFCPRMDEESLGVAGPFVDLADLMDGPQPGRKNRFAPAAHTFQAANPLVVFTRFRLGGVGVLGGGLDLQQAVVRTMARRINAALAGLGKGLDRDDRRVTALGITRDDLDGVQCTFLDGQGSEDLLLMVACANYSVGAALVTQLRCLTLGDVFAVDQTLPDRLDGGPVPLLGEILRRYGAEQKARHPKGGWGSAAGRRRRRPAGEEKDEPRPWKPAKDGARGWESNHVFSDSYTTLGVTAAALRDPDGANVRGYAQVVAQIDGNPGHLQDIERVLRESYRGLVRDAKVRVPASVVGPARSFHRFLVGRHDYLEVVGENPDGPFRAISVRRYFKYLGHVLHQIGGDPAGGGPAAGCETGLLDFTSSIVVPFPRLGQIPAVNHDAHFPLLTFLDDLRQKLFEEGGAAPRFDPARLRNTTRGLRTPWSLCGALERLFQNFANQLADPHLYDSILDLYDSFAALYAYLTEYLPAQQGAGPDAGTPFGSFLTKHLNGVLDALKNAADHRVRLMLPNTDMRDTAVDLRGGLSKLVAAADVPLKCGLFLLNHALGRPEAPGPAARGLPHGLPLDRVAGVTRLTFDPQTVCHTLYTNRSDPRCLAHVHMDVGHVFRPVRFLAHLHECAHLFRFMHGSPPADPGGLDPAARAARDEMADEVYAELLTHLMVFGTGTDLFLRHNVSSYGCQPHGQGSATTLRDTDPHARQRFFEVLLRGFLVTHPITVCLGERKQPDPLTWDPDTLRQVLGREGVEEDFVQMVERVGPFHAGHRRWWSADTKRTWGAAFKGIIKTRGDAAATAWHDALVRFKHQPPAAQPQQELSRLVVEALADGRPLIARAPADVPEADRPFETIRLVCRLLAAHAKFCYGRLDADVGNDRGLHLRRRPRHGEVAFADFPWPKGGWNVFQLDATHGGLFCVDPAVRRERIRREVVILKTFWDISTHIRAERLHYLLCQLWPEPAPHR